MNPESSECLVFARINGAQFLKGSFFILKSLNDDVTLEFSKYDISSVLPSKENTTIAKISIDSTLILKYDFSLEVKDVIQITVNTGKLENTCRAMGKKVNCCLLIYANDPNLYIGADDSTDRRHKTVIKSTKRQTTFCEIPSIGENCRICRVTVSHFVNQIKLTEQEGTKSILFVPYKDGLKIVGLDRLDIPTSFAYLGDCLEPFEESFNPKTREILNQLDDSSSNEDSESQEIEDDEEDEVEQRLKMIKSGIKMDTSQGKIFVRLGSVSTDRDSCLVDSFYDPNHKTSKGTTVPIFAIKGPVGMFGKFEIYIRNKKCSTTTTSFGSQLSW